MKLVAELLGQGPAALLTPTEPCLPAVVLALQGRARGFKFDELTELPEDFENFFVRLQRRGNQTLQDYAMEYSHAERQLRVTHKVELPEKVKAWWFYAGRASHENNVR